MAAPFPFRSVSLIGVGLLGGSLARAIKRADPTVQVWGCSKEPGDLEQAQKEGVLDGFDMDAAEVAGKGDLVFYATPLFTTLAFLESHKDRWKSGATISDVASLNLPVLERARELGIEDRVVTSHPLAGRERSGFSVSRPDLFDGADIWVSQMGAAEGRADHLLKVWSDLGAKPGMAEPKAHDADMIHISHLPQLLSNALASVYEDFGITPADLGTGGLAMIRLAASDPGMWRDIFPFQAEEFAEVVRSLGVELETLANMLVAGEFDGIEELMARTRAWRDR